MQIWFFWKAMFCIGAVIELIAFMIWYWFEQRRQQKEHDETGFPMFGSSYCHSENYKD